MQPARLSSRTCLPIAVALIHTKKAPYKKLNLIERPPADPIGCITQREQNPAPHGELFIIVAAACVTKLSPQPYCTALSGTKGTSPHFCYVPACRKTFSCYQHVKDLFRSCDPARFIWRPCKPACRGICPLRLALCRWRPQNTCRI